MTIVHQTIGGTNGLYGTVW